MAVEVLDCLGFQNLQREEHADEAMVAHLQSMQNLVTLLAKQQAPHRQQFNEEDCVVPATADASTISGFRKLVAVLGGAGHARFRRGPASESSSSLGLDAYGKVTPSSSLHKIAAQIYQGFKMNTQAGPLSVSSQNEAVDADTCAHTTSLPDASLGTTDTQKMHVSQAFSSCSPPYNEGRGHGCASGVSMDRGLPKITSRNTQGSSQVSGHARCRSSTTQTPHHAALACEDQPCLDTLGRSQDLSCDEQDRAAFMPASSFRSSVSIEGGAGTVRSGKPVISSGRPPLPPKKRKAPEKIEEGQRSTKCHRSAHCHCAKRRKEKTRRVVRVSGIGLKGAEIPADGYSWCIYGEKLSRDSLQHRVYYKCSNVRGCPAWKCIERASDNSDTLVVTYGREHLHPQIHKVVTAASE